MNRQLGFLLAAAALSGCGGSGLKTYQVMGTVSKAGVGLEGVQVILTPTATDGKVFDSAYGRTDAAGKFSVTMPTGQLGAPAGDYKIVLKNPSVTSNLDPEQAKQRLAAQYAAGRSKGQRSSAPPPAPDEEGPIPIEYTKDETTPLKYTVPGDALTIEVP
jgi:hypothetical protein